MASVLCLAGGSPALGQENEDTNAPGRDIERSKLAQTGMKFLGMSVVPHAASMGNAVTAMTGKSTALFYNPASMAALGDAFHASLGQSQWIADINYNYVSAAFSPESGQYGTFGVSLMSVDYGDFHETVRTDNEQGYERTGTYGPSALAVGVGYARPLSDQFSVGGHLKYARQSLGESPMAREGGGLARRSYAKGAAVVDFGVLYHTGFRSLNFALSARNFSREYTYAEESFELPLTLQFGVAMDVLDLTRLNQTDHSLLLAIDTSRPRDYSQQIKIGGEYIFSNVLAFRAGYVYPEDEQGINLGVGLQHALGNIKFAADYAYTQFGTFGNVNRFSFQFGL